MITCRVRLVAIQEQSALPSSFTILGVNDMVNLLILGGTGLVGQQVIYQALGDASISRVIAPTRRPLAPHAKLINPIVDFKALPTDAAWWAADAVLCALGTTMRLAGSRARFREVDHDYVIDRKSVV